MVRVPERPPAGWSGEHGYLDRAVLARHLPAGYPRRQYFACGPGPLVTAVEDALADLGVSAERLHTERFDFV